MTSPRRSTRITGRHHYHEAVRPCSPHQYSTPHGSAARSSPFHARPQATTAPLAARGRRQQVPTFHTRARTKLAPPSCRTAPGQSAGTRQTDPGPSWQTRFCCHLEAFDTSSVDRLRSPSWPIPDALEARLFPQRSTPRLLTAAPCGGLRPPPAGRPRRTTSPNGASPSISNAVTASTQSDLLLDPPCCVRGTPSSFFLQSILTVGCPSASARLTVSLMC